MNGGPVERAPRARSAGPPRGPSTPPTVGLLRGGALATLSALLTAVGHVAGGGALPDLTLLAVLLPLLAAVFVSLAQCCRGLAGTVVMLAAGQVVLHHLMVLLHPPHVAEPGALGGPAMLGMHAAITVVMAAALRHADRATAAMVAALRRVLPRRLAPPPVDPPLPTRPVPDLDVPARLARVLTVAHARRGPPVAC